MQGLLLSEHSANSSNSNPTSEERLQFPSLHCHTRFCSIAPKAASRPWKPDSGFTSLQCCSAWALIWYAAADSVYWEQLPDNLYGFPLYPKPLGPLRSQLLEINTFSERVCKLWFLKNDWGRFLWYRMQNNALYFNLNLVISSQIQSNIKLVWIFR